MRALMPWRAGCARMRMPTRVRARARAVRRVGRHGRMRCRGVGRATRTTHSTTHPAATRSAIRDQTHLTALRRDLDLRNLHVKLYKSEPTPRPHLPRLGLMCAQWRARHTHRSRNAPRPRRLPPSGTQRNWCSPDRDPEGRRRAHGGRWSGAAAPPTPPARTAKAARARNMAGGTRGQRGAASSAGRSARTACAQGHRAQAARARARPAAQARQPGGPQAYTRQANTRARTPARASRVASLRPAVAGHGAGAAALTERPAPTAEAHRCWGLVGVYHSPHAQDRKPPMASG